MINSWKLPIQFMKQDKHSRHKNQHKDLLNAFRKYIQ